MNKRKINTFPLKIAVLGHKTIPSRQGRINGSHGKTRT